MFQTSFLVSSNLWPNLLNRFSWSFAEFPDGNLSMYDEDVQELVNSYRNSISVDILTSCNVQNGTVLLPVTAISMFKQLLEISRKRLVILSGDIVDSVFERNWCRGLEHYRNWLVHEIRLLASMGRFRCQQTFMRSILSLLRRMVLSSNLLTWKVLL